MKLTAKDIEISVAKYMDPRVNLIVPNASWGLGLHECDLLVISKAGYASEIEIKVSKSDLVRDKEKRHQHASERIKALWFAIPYTLLPHVEHVPSNAGILVIREDGICRTHRKPTLRQAPKKWTPHEMFHAARLAAMRIWGLKIKIRNLTKPPNASAPPEAGI